MSATQDSYMGTARDEIKFRILNYNLDLPYLVNEFAPDSPLQPQVISVNLVNFDLDDPTQGPQLRVSMRVPASKYAYLVANNREIPFKLQGVRDVPQPAATAPSREATSPEAVIPEVAPPAAQVLNSLEDSQNGENVVYVFEREPESGVESESGVEPELVAEPEPEPEPEPESESESESGVESEPAPETMVFFESADSSKLPVEPKAARVPREKSQVVQGNNPLTAYGSLRFQKKPKEDAKTKKGKKAQQKDSEPAKFSKAKETQRLVPPAVQPPTGKYSSPSPIPSASAKQVYRDNRRLTADEQERGRVKSQEMRQFHRLKRLRSPEPASASTPQAKKERPSKKEQAKPKDEPKAQAAKASQTKSLTVEGANSCFDLLEFREITSPKVYPATAAPSLQSFEPATSLSWRNLFGENTCARKKPLRPTSSLLQSHTPNVVTVPKDSLSREIGHEITDPLLPRHKQEDENFSTDEITMLYHWVVQGKSLKFISGKYKSKRTDLSISRMIMKLRVEIKNPRVIPKGSFNFKKLQPSTDPIPNQDITNFVEALKSLPSV